MRVVDSAKGNGPDSAKEYAIMAFSGGNASWIAMMFAQFTRRAYLFLFQKFEVACHRRRASITRGRSTRGATFKSVQPSTVAI
jgi:hypothetical protein